MDIYTSNTFDVEIEGGDLKFTTSPLEYVKWLLLVKKRATSSQVSEAEYREGWVGDLINDEELGSALWLLIENTTISERAIEEVQLEVVDSLSILQEEGLVNNIEVSVSKQGQSGLLVNIVLDENEVNFSV